MLIGEVAKASGVSSKLIRYYESIGLIIPASRNDSGYREYNQRDVHNISFIKRARELGFSIEKIQKLLDLWNNKERESADVKKIAQEHILDLEIKMNEIKNIVDELNKLLIHCHGDARPECPILNRLGDDSTTP